MRPKIEGDEIQIFIIEPVYNKKVTKVKGSDGKPMYDIMGNIMKSQTDKFIRHNYLRVWMKKRDITIYGQFTGSKGQVVKNQCLIFNSASNNSYRVAHTVDEIHEAKHDKIERNIGFK